MQKKNLCWAITLCISILIATIVKVYGKEIYSTAHRSVYVITEWSDLNKLVKPKTPKPEVSTPQKPKKIKKHKGKIRKVVRIELVRVIPQRGNNPFYQTQPVKNTYNPVTGIVEERAVDESPQPSPSPSPQPNPQPQPVCDVNHLNLCSDKYTCGAAGGFWTDYGCKSCPDAEGYGENIPALSMGDRFCIVLDKYGELYGRNVRLLKCTTKPCSFDNNQYEALVCYEKTKDLWGEYLTVSQYSGAWNGQNAPEPIRQGSGYKYFSLSNGSCTINVRISYTRVGFQDW